MSIELPNFPQPRSDAEMQEYIWKKETLPRMKAAGLDVRFCRREDFKSNLQQRQVYRRVWAACCGVGAIMALVGPRGTGKTTIAAQLIRSRAECESLPPWDRQPPYRKLWDLIARYKPLYGDFGTIDTESLTAARETYVDFALHIIDEIHECDDMKMKDRILTDIIDRCYSRRRDVILISNQTPEEFHKTTSDSILSRIAEHGDVIECNWASFRDKT